MIVLGNLNGNGPNAIANQVASTIYGEKVTLPSERKEITLSRDILQAYVGTYEVNPQVGMNITLEGDHLATQLTGQPKFPIFAETQTLFFLKAVDAQLEFGQDASGKVTQVTLHQNGRDMVWKKK